MPRRKNWKLSKSKIGAANPRAKSGGLDDTDDREEESDLLYKNRKTSSAPCGKTSLDDTEDRVEESALLYKNRKTSSAPCGKTRNSGKLSGKISGKLSGKISGNLSDKISGKLSGTLSGNQSSTSGNQSSTSGNQSSTLPGNSDKNEAHSSIISLFSSTFLKFGNFDQSDHRFSIESRGNQCTCNCLVFLALSNGKTGDGFHNLDAILDTGDKLYKSAISNLKNEGRFRNMLLTFDEIPIVLDLGTKIYTLEKKDVLFGTAIQSSSSNEDFLTLQEALNECFRQSNCALVMIGSICSAIYKNGDTYVFFDSHSHSQSGLYVPSDFSGNSILIGFSTVENLLNYMYAFYTSMHINLLSQFEMLPVCFEEVDQIHENIIEQQMNNYFSDQQRKKNKLVQATSTLEQQKSKTPYMKTYMENRRKNQHFRSEERQKERQNKQMARKDDEFKLKEAKDKQEARKDPKFRSKERQNQLQSKQKARKENEFKLKEAKDKQEARKDPKFRSKERQNELANKQEARKDPKFRSKERQNELANKHKARKDPKFRSKERQNEFAYKHEARKDPKFRSKERQNELANKHEARKDPKFRSKERQNELANKHEARKDQKFRSKERQNELQSKQKARKEDEFKLKEAKNKQEARKDQNFRSQEKQKELDSKRLSRKDKYFRLKEAELKRKNRENEHFQQAEANRDLKRKRDQRSNPDNLEIERIAKLISRQENPRKDREINRSSKQIKRRNREYVQHENDLKKRKSHGSSLSECIDKFKKATALGPSYICSCCHQTWFAQSVANSTNLKSISQELLKKCLTNLKSVDDKEWICNTCVNSLRQNQIPRLSIANLMGFPKKPKELQLFPLEERLISLRIPFMQIHELPTGGQYSVKGNVVNVPVDVQPTVNALPRRMDQSGTIAVKLKKKLAYKTSDYSENVRPAAVITGLHYLMITSELYMSSGVKIDNQWIQQIQNETENVNDQVPETSDSQVENDHNDSDDDHFSEIDETEHVGNLDTLLDEVLDESSSQYDKEFVFAPGEGQKPIGLYCDSDAEYLAFPTIFCGQRRPDNKERTVPVHYTDIVKWELRSNDRRVAQSVPNIFFKFKKVQMKNISDKVNLALRKCKSEGKSWTAKDILNPSTVNKLVRLDEGYYIFRTLRNSPVYLEKRKKDVFAMIRQLGLPTWFGSLSSADTRWKELLKILGNLNEDKNYSDSDIDNMSWQEKTRLVQKDPVTCSRFFDHRVQQFIKIVLKSNHNPVGKVSDYFYRVEFQQRGSPHIHMLIWITDAPKYKQDSDEAIAEYIDQYISCSLNLTDCKELVDLQLHKHSKSCRKKTHAICRFGFPLPPFSKTVILEPLEEEIDKYKALYKDIQQKIDSLHDTEGVEDMSFEYFLHDILEMSEADYIKAVRSTLNGAKVFLKRKPSEVRVNAYMKAVLSAWKANHDLQFVLDPYACAVYIVSYISKSQKGMSALLDQAAKEARQGNLDLKQQVRLIGNYFTNSVETCAQEAVYILLQIPLTKASREVVFINTSQSEKRTFLLKNTAELEKLSPDSTDIEADNSIKRYSNRPKALENWCLADYMSQLEIVYPKRSKSVEETENSLENEQYQNDDESEQELESSDVSTGFKLELKNGIVIKQRNNFRVIRYVRFSKKTDSENFYRERLMLFHPWRKESDLKQNHETYEKMYFTVSRTVENKAKQYENKAEELDRAIELAESEPASFDELAPGTEQAEQEASEEGVVDSEKYVHFNPERPPEHRHYDIGRELDMSAASADLISHAKRIGDNDYYQLLRSLNLKQREFFQHVMKWVRTKQDPLYAFLTGGAGVGKSVVVRALFQDLHRHLCSVEGEDPDDTRILLCAFTGKAAFNIGGVTLHNAFQIQPSKSLLEQTLSCDVLNTLRMKYRHLSVIIIDEISMVGNKMFSLINTRLQKIKGNSQFFGGVSVIAVGDFFQLQPVYDGWVFNDLEKGITSLAPNVWKELFSFHELIEIMRQKDDLKFAELLNRLRDNSLTKEDEDVLKSREVKDPETVHGIESAIHLFANNKLVDKFNNDHISKLNTEIVTVKAFDTVGGDLSQQVKKNLIDHLPTKQDKTANLAKEVQLAINMKYDLTANIDVTDGLSNGSSNILKCIEYKTNSNRPSIVWVKFENEKIGSATRRKFSHLFSENIDESWTPIFDIKRSFVYRYKSFERIQFPLRPAAAKTIHKSQGDTANQVVVNMENSRRVPHIHYVAMSRVTSLSGLHILQLHLDKIDVADDVRKEMRRLRSDASLQLCFTPLYNVPPAYVKLVFNNARSFHAHYQDVKADPNILDADIIGIAESRLIANDSDDSISMPGYQISARLDQQHDNPRSRPPHGLTLYSKNDSCLINVASFSNSELEFIMADISSSKGQIQVVIVYKAPHCKLETFKKILISKLLPNLDLVSSNIVIMGDFNFDIKTGNQAFLSFMENTFKCNQIISKTTTIYDSQLDLIFVHLLSDLNIYSDVLEAYWSDHGIIYVALDMK